VKPTSLSLLAAALSLSQFRCDKDSRVATLSNIVLANLTISVGIVKDKTEYQTVLMI